jgi:hypothetical protein
MTCGPRLPLTDASGVAVHFLHGAAQPRVMPHE